MATKNNSSGKIILVIAIVFIAVIGGYLVWQHLQNNEDDNPLITIVSVTPNYSTIQVPSQSCKTVTNTKMVKNPNSGFFSSVFENKPKYIKQSSNKQVCQEIMTESQVINNYTISYQIKSFVESMVVQTPPAVNTQMPLTALQQYQHTESAVVLNATASAPVVVNNSK